MMRDADVRTALLSELALQYEGDRATRIVQEMGIWSGSVRVDVAVINGQLHGYELKSARDTLERLEVQAELYNQVFDQVTLVTAENHYYKAVKKIPKWWGISVAIQQQDGSVKIRDSRAAKLNKKIVPIQLARLLWRPELLEILSRHEIDRGVRSTTVEMMARRLAECLPISILQDEVRDTLKARVGWLGQPVCDKR